MFDAAPHAPDTPLMQDPAFAAALRLLGQTPVTLPGGLTVLSRRIAGVPVLMLPRAAPPADLGAQLAEAGLHRHPLILSPEHADIRPRALRIAPAQTLLRVYLTPPRNIRRAALHQKWRNQLRNAERSALRVIRRPLCPDHPLLAQEAAQACARRYRNWPRALTAAFARVAPEQTHLFTALLRGHPVAHMLFLTHGGRASYHIGHTLPEGKRTQAHNLLLWQAMCLLADSGHHSLDLGPDAPNAPGLTRFKTRAGARPQLTGGTWLRWRPLAPADNP